MFKDVVVFVFSEDDVARDDVVICDAGYFTRFNGEEVMVAEFGCGLKHFWGVESAGIDVGDDLLFEFRF